MHVNCIMGSRRGKGAGCFYAVRIDYLMVVLLINLPYVNLDLKSIIG